MRDALEVKDVELTETERTMPHGEVIGHVNRGGRHRSQ